MDSRLHGVPLSVEMGAFSNNTISGIRAPLTIDESDLESSLSSKSRRNSIASSYYSNSELESEGFVSGEDESETRPYVTDQDEEVLEKTHFFHEYGFYKPSVVKQTGEVVEENSFRNGNGFSRPSVRSPDENFAQESGNADGNSFFRPFVGNPYEEFAQVSGNVNGDSFLRPFVGNPDERICKVISNANDSGGSRSFLSESDHDFVENESYGLDNDGCRPLVAVTDEENFGNGPRLISDIIKISELQKFHIPIAKISRDSDDDDSLGSEVLEEEGFLGIVRVPSFEVPHRHNSAPKIRMSEADEGDDYESQAENMVEMEFVKNLVISNGVLVPKDENEPPDTEDVTKCVISSGTVQDRGPDVSKEDKANSLDVNEQYNIDVEIDVTDDREKCVDLVGHSNTDLDDDFVFNQNVESEELGTEREQEIKDRPSDFLGLPEELTENMPDSRLGDASSTGSDDCQSLYEVTELDQEITKEAESSEELSGEVNSSAFYADTNAMVVERGLDSIKLSHEEILLDHSQEITDTDGPQSVDGVDNFPLENNLADVGPILFSERPIIEARNRDLFVPPSINFEVEEALSEGEKKKKLERIQQIRVKYLRFLHRLGRFSEDSIASKVLRQLSISEEKSSSQAFFVDSARERGDLNFSLCILVIGKTGVGKSAAINSIFGESKTMVNAFEPSTSRVEEIIGNIDGVEVKVFDTPGLRTSLIDQPLNRKILSSIKKLMRKSPPDVILYVNRLDTQFSNLNDLPLLKSITSCLGSSLWQKSIIAFTHADLVPPDGSDGYPLSYEEFIDQQSRAVQQLINQSAGEMSNDLMVPVSLLENHQFVKKNENQERSKLMVLCYSMKILSEMSSVVKIDNLMDNLKEFFRYRFLDPSCRILTRPVFGSYYDCSYDGVLIDVNLDNVNHLAAVFSIQLTHVEKDLNINVSPGSNKKPSGKVSVKTGGLDQLHIAALALFPIAKAVFGKIFSQSAEG